jgi:uncharacterized membrane protein YhaH (DUF805 family)
MLNIIMPILTSIGLFASSSGEIYGDYLLIAVLGFQIFMITFVSAIVLIGRHETELQRSSFGMNLMILVIYAIATYQLYATDYVFIAGMATITLVISFLTNTGHYIYYGGDEEEEDIDEKDE